MKSVFHAMCLSLVVWSAGCAGSPVAVTPRELRVTAVSGADVRRLIASYRGKQPVLVNVWATWCAPCVQEFPALVELRRKYEGRLAVLLVSADFSDQDTAVRNFLISRGVDWETYIKSDGDEAFIAALDDQWSGALPVTVIYDMEGGRVAFWEGAARLERFEEEVRRVVARGP